MNRKPGKKKVLEFTGTVQRGRVINDMVE